MLRLQPGTIPDLASLREALQKAIELEHATIPPYLTAYYTLSGTGAGPTEAKRALRRIAIQEMQHMRLACNVLNAIGGRPKIGGPDFIPDYPGALPMGIGGEDKLEVGIVRYCRKTVRDVFMEIEEPEEPIDIPVKERLLAATPMTYETIGEFYAAIAEAIARLGQAIFTGDPARQVPRNGGDRVTDVASALAAIKTIVVEGEGTPTSPLQSPGTYAHYYRFAELYRGMKIVAAPSSPVGYYFDPSQPIEIDDATDVIRMVDNPRKVDLAGNPQAEALADQCDAVFTELLGQLQATFDGDPDGLGQTFDTMSSLGEAIEALLAQPLTTGPGAGYFAGPRFLWVGT